MAKNQKKQKGGRDQRLEIRLTASEKATLKEVARKLYTQKTPEKSRTDTIVYAVDILENILEWDSQGYKFFIGNPEKETLKEVEFDLKKL